MVNNFPETSTCGSGNVIAMSESALRLRRVIVPPPRMMFSLNVATRLAEGETPVAPSAGLMELIAGGVVSLVGLPMTSSSRHTNAPEFAPPLTPFAVILIDSIPDAVRSFSVTFVVPAPLPSG